MLRILESGGPILWTILGLSFVAFVIIIERLLYLRSIKANDDQLLSRLQSALSNGHFDEALSICEMNPAPITNLMKIGINYRAIPEDALRDRITGAAQMEIPKLEKFLSTLGTIAHVAPLLGLLGTVTGNIDAFNVLGSFDSAGDPSVLARGISEALITTAAGIMVSIPAIGFYNYLVSKVNHIIINLENRVNDLVLLLKR